MRSGDFIHKCPHTGESPSIRVENGLYRGECVRSVLVPIGSGTSAVLKFRACRTNPTGPVVPLARDRRNRDRGARESGGDFFAKRALFTKP